MTTTTPLNPSLYQTLQAQFGDIRTTNAGQPQLSRRVPDPRRPGALTTQVSQRGEQYAFNCPFCGDERGRLYLSYLYGEKDASGSRNYNLWCCHNEKCQESKANRKILRSRLAQPIGRPAPFNPQPAEQPPRREMLLPEGLIPIATLSAAHPATAYLLGRGFVLQELQELWEVAFCEWCCCWPRVPERIIIPVWRPAKLFAPSDDQSLVLGGWQARSIPGLGSPDEPKYLSAAGMKKSELLYGLHLAKQTQGPVFLVEGPTDCWRIGPGAVAIFGKDLSQTQKLLLVLPNA